MRSIFPRRQAAGTSGQALVEFAVVIVPFLVLLMGVLDLGRGIYMLNGTAEAARDIARVTIVHPYDVCCDLGSSAEAQEVIEVQRRIVPGLDISPSTDIVCVDISDTVVDDDKCGKDTKVEHYIRVRVRAPFSPITPIVSAFGSHTFESYSRIQVP